ncbi:hypothetical protein H257_12714 [Aphanomyces astaci]|uniref:Uncharacterized protein n=1 Tax=Aphanomyces astaci TaxID=112090 RepID=W4FZP5_APHAT|nr:hypothetical protein H257_12714 [Aphanomyces astaci]ETV72249.1 hypothetical protein H257_12714 [Aphanomyces astaci]|eukprot:XP_009838317.1 hypothetical protein H257_12714 [Aphanomyces astaci]
MDTYRDASSAAYIKHIAIPTLCVSARDDPICPHTVIPYDECRSNPNVVLCVTHSGGHVGCFTSDHLLDDKPGMWCADVIAQYCYGMMAKEQDNEIEASVLLVHPPEQRLERPVKLDDGHCTSRVLPPYLEWARGGDTSTWAS